MSAEAAMVWCVVSFVAGWKLCAHVITRRWAWRQCCLRHYQSDEHKGEGE